MRSPVGYPPRPRALRMEGTRDVVLGILTSLEGYGTFLPSPQPQGYSGWVSTRPFPYGASLSTRYPAPE